MVKKFASEAGDGSTGGMTKTEAIRAALAKDPGAMPKALAEKLSSEGFDVKPQHVSTIKNLLKKEAEGGVPRTPGKPGRKPRAVPAVAAAKPQSRGGDLTFESLRKAKELSAQLGGVEKAREALDALTQLTG
jgi:hypothetical protein